MYSVRHRVIRLCIPILMLGLIIEGLLLVINPVVAYAQPLKAQNALSAFATSGTKVHYTANSATHGFEAAGNYTLEASEIIGTNAHLNLLSDPLYPTLTFTAATMSGFSLSHPFYSTALLLSSNGTVTATGVAIKTSLFKDVGTALKSFANKADLLVLATGGTVGQLVMKNVNLTVDHSLNTDTFAAAGFHLAITTNLPNITAVPPSDAPTPTTTPSATSTATPSQKVTPTPTATPAPGPTPVATPTPTPPHKKCRCLFLICWCTSSS
ncbi:hypothetical protein [Dictyobacter kobayashii]|uniref:Uncharacterized protein n=1 Tax=Dictyobacter kobayashii TaxID=2014872 RepID=A0A402ALX2_9CHLR|nr:hypothetical protein [Dictyobacter kobayashii]GCE20122.1 hypothetical protein KDK_39220 [Dictyobacter kobayashii]